MNKNIDKMISLSKEKKTMLNTILDLTNKQVNIIKNENFRKVLIMHSIEDAYVMPVAGLTIYTKDDKKIS